MSYRYDEPNTRKQIARFSVDEWIEFRERLERLNNAGELTERNYKILYELIVKQRSTAELAYLAKTDEDFKWAYSNQGKPLCVRRIQTILTDYFPEFHIQTTHKKNRKHQKFRTEQTRLRQIMIDENSRCAKCGSTHNLQMHHMIPVSCGGDNNAANLIILCENCHYEVTIYNRSITFNNENVAPN